MTFRTTSLSGRLTSSCKQTNMCTHMAVSTFPVMVFIWQPVNTAHLPKHQPHDNINTATMILCKVGREVIYYRNNAVTTKDKNLTGPFKGSFKKNTNCFQTKLHNISTEIKITLLLSASHPMRWQCCIAYPCVHKCVVTCQHCLEHSPDEHMEIGLFLLHQKQNLKARTGVWTFPVEQPIYVGTKKRIHCRHP